MRRPTTAALLAPACLLTLALTACTGLDTGSESADPTPVHSPAQTLDPAEANDSAAASSSGTEVVDPGWDTAAQEAGGVFLSMHETDSDLEFRAVDSDGTILWTAQRPRVCSGFFVTGSGPGASSSESGSQPVAVLMDQSSSQGGSFTTTASGFDLLTGKSLWGPVEVPGPLLGSGLVFAGPPQDFIGEGGPRVALDPATGQRLATEDAEGSEDTGSPRIITLLGRHLVLAEEGKLIGEHSDGHRLWTLDAEDLGVSAGEAREMPWEQLGDSHALIGSAGDRHRSLINLHSGAIIATDIEDAGFDAATHTLVTSDSTLRGFSLDGTQKWEEPLADDAELTAVGAGLVVTETGTGTGSDGVETRSAADGAATAPGTAGFGAPHHIADSGARLIGDLDSPLLVPAEKP